MNEQQLAAVKQALEALESERDKYLEWGDEDGAPEDVYEAITALQSIISQDALDKKAENARELGLDYEPAPVQEKCFLCGERVASCTSDVCPKSAQPAVQEGRDWSLLEATQESLREHMAEIKRLKAEQPVPVKTYHDGKPWPVAPKPWVGLTDDEIRQCETTNSRSYIVHARAIEAKLKEKNT
jgi:hypothetical protein